MHWSLHLIWWSQVSHALVFSIKESQLQSFLWPNNISLVDMPYFLVHFWFFGFIVCLFVRLVHSSQFCKMSTILCVFLFFGGDGGKYCYNHLYKSFLTSIFVGWRNGSVDTKQWDSFPEYPCVIPESTSSQSSVTQFLGIWHHLFGFCGH